MHRCTCLHWGTCGVQETCMIPYTLGYGDCLKTWHILCTSRICSDFHIMPIDMLSECCFDCVTHLKCHFIYGYLIAQSFICSWLHLFVSWLKWMHLQGYIKKSPEPINWNWRKATECTFPCYFLFFGALLQHLFFFSQRRERISFFCRATVRIQ